MDLNVRSESPEDIPVIKQLTITAFTGKWYSEGTEHLVIEGLRDSGCLEVSLVAVVGGKVVGHVAFSKVKISGKDLGWYGVGPISVHPLHQKLGIGGKLLEAGLQILQQQKNAKGCVVEGDPKYYNKFGFKSYAGLVYPKGDPQYFMALPLVSGIIDGKEHDDGGVPMGSVEYHESFYIKMDPK